MTNKGTERMSSFPDWLIPMAATLTQERFTGPDWAFERKFDGIRLMTYKNEGVVDLFSRNQLPQNLPSIAEAIQKLPAKQLILDGEVTWGKGSSVYHIFDILWLDLSLIHISEPTRLLSISYAVFCLKKKKKKK